jgi:hypothetical protein
MSFTILNVAYPYAPVGPDAVGGSEQVLSALDAGITRAGHRSVVIAQEGSQTAGTLISTKVPPGPVTEGLRTWATAAHQHSIDKALRSFHIDLVHFHGIDCCLYLVLLCRARLFLGRSKPDLDPSRLMLVKNAIGIYGGHHGLCLSEELFCTNNSAADQFNHFRHVAAMIAVAGLFSST